MWQPIETAPKDQTFLAVLNCAGEQTICTMRWAVAEAKNSRSDNPVFHVERVTHWMPLPDLPGAQTQPAPSFADAYQGAMEEVAIWKKRALEAEDMNRKFIAEINGHAYMGEPAQPAPSLPDTHNDMVVGLDYQGAMSCARQRAKKEAGLLYPEGDARKEEKERELASEYYRQYTTPNPEAKP